MKKKIILLPLFLFVFQSFENSQSSNEEIKGIVCLKVKSCKYIVVCLANGNYALIEDYSYRIDKDDILIGTFQKYGFVDVYNFSKKQKNKVYVEEWELTEKRIIEKYQKKCDK